MQLDSHRARAFRTLVERRCKREPTAYLLGYREFYGRRFAVTPATLIPRPETEGLVGLALERIDRLGGSRLRLLDVGTGSGAIAITLLTQRPQLTAVGVDNVPAALAVAKTNAQAHAVDQRLKLVASNLVDAVRRQFPLVVANLPYIPSATIDKLEPEVARYEPRGALDGGPDGLQLIGTLLEVEQILEARGSIVAEIGEDQGDRAQQLARAHFPDARVSVENDDAGLPRFLVVDHDL
jgi:release factor glutamine methyltransferase